MNLSATKNYLLSNNSVTNEKVVPVPSFCSKDFVSKNYKRFKAVFQCKHEKIPMSVKGLEGIYSLKRLSEHI